MSVFEAHGMCCPRCGKDEHLDVTASVDVRLTPLGSDAELAFDGSHQWDDNSVAACLHCDWSGLVGATRIPDVRRKRLLNGETIDFDWTGPVTAYTDGGCDPNPGPGGWAVVLVDQHGETEELFGSEGHTTNNQMELRAVIEALKATSVCSSHITIKSDSKYVVDGINRWVRGWIARGWRLKNNKPVSNKDLWESMHRLRTGRPIIFEWVKGHSVNPFNNRADELTWVARGKSAP